MIKVNGKVIQFEQFPNGETRLVKESVFVALDTYEGTVDNDVVNIEFKYEDDSDLIKLLFVKKYLEQILAKGLFYYNLHIYYMPYSRMDRVENNSPFTLKYVAEFINNLGFDELVVTEPHSDVTPALLNDSHAEFINVNLLEEVKEDVEFEDEIDYIVFPDNGASKRYSNLKVKNVLVGHKHRDFETGMITSLDIIGNINDNGKKAIIVDDLSSYGGTFVATAKELRKKGIEKVYLLVAHAENSIFKGRLFDHVDKVFTTDSILTEQANWENQKFVEKLHVFNIGEKGE